jgi:hypothetical protein
MDIRDVSRLGDGRTILVGIAHGSARFVRSVECDLLVDGEVAERIVVTEELPEGTDRAKRAMGTADQVSVTDETIRTGRCRLVERTP